MIANDLLLVHPLTSMTGYVTYLQYTAGTNKGDVKQGNVFRNVWGQGDAQKFVDYTSERISETIAAPINNYLAMWQPLNMDKMTVKVAGGTQDVFKNITVRFMDGTTPKVGYVSAATVNAPVTTEFAYYDAATGTMTKEQEKTVFGGQAGNLTRQFEKNVAGVTIDTTNVFCAKNDGTGEFEAKAPAGEITVAYIYQNEVIPQNDLPILNAELKSLALAAHPRRIAIERYVA